VEEKEEEELCSEGRGIKAIYIYMYINKALG
jgi:hypothetical protein